MMKDIEKTAFAQYLELEDVLKTVGILDMTDSEDFISKVWGVAVIENPRIIGRDCGEDCQMIDFDFLDLTATLVWWADENHPRLSKNVEFWIKGYEEPAEFDFSEGYIYE